MYGTSHPSKTGISKLFSAKGQGVNIFNFVNQKVSITALNSATVVQKQPDNT